MYKILAKSILSARSIKKSVIRKKLAQRLSNEQNNPIDFNNWLKNEAIALDTDVSKKQHYEVPTEFFKMILGSNLKYSCNYFDQLKINKTKDFFSDLSASEEKMLDIIIQRSGVKDKMKVLDLGCGWGSLSLYLAKKYPGCKITSVSHSKTQRKFILEKADSAQLKNIQVITQDVNNLSLKDQYDVIISIELFEHLHNYKKILNKLSSYLNHNGKIFIHHFCHKNLNYTFDGDNSWMAKYFFESGKMLSFDFLPKLDLENITIEKSWKVNGKNYGKTCYLWEKNLDNNISEILKVFKSHYGSTKSALKWILYWQLFILACMELFNYNDGDEWFVAHHLFKTKK